MKRFGFILVTHKQFDLGKMAFRFWFNFKMISSLLSLTVAVVLFSICSGASAFDNESTSISFEYIPPRLTHIVIPFYTGGIPELKKNLLSWNKHLPCTEGLPMKDHHPLTLVLLSSRLEQGEEESLRKFYLEEIHENVRKCFSNEDILVKTAGLSAKDNAHYILATRFIWERLISNHIGLDYPSNTLNVTYAFLMEPDARPVRNNWLWALSKEINAGERVKFDSFDDFQFMKDLEASKAIWVRGSIYRGTNPIVMKQGTIGCKYHINGNAIYQIGAGKRSFFRYYAQHIRKSFPIESAYDSTIWDYLMEHYEAHRRISHRFQYTAIIQNHWNSLYKMSEILHTSPGTFLVHGGTAEYEPNLIRYANA